MFDWNDIRHFLAVAEHGTVSAAARTLRVSQPTVGRRIDELEARLQTRLFDRSSQGFVLTERGRQVLEAARCMEQCAWRIDHQAASDAELRGIVRVATSIGLGAHWLARQIPEFRARHPDIRLEIIIDVKLHDLLRREADLALRVGGPGCEDLVGRVVGEAGFGLYASHAYLERHGVPQSTADLCRHVIIESVSGLEQLPQVRRLRALSQGAAVALGSDSLATQLAAAIEGVGLLALPNYMAAGQRELRRILPEAFDLRRDVWLLTHRDLTTCVRIRAAQSFLVERMRADELFRPDAQPPSAVLDRAAGRAA